MHAQETIEHRPEKDGALLFPLGEQASLLAAAGGCDLSMIPRPPLYAVIRGAHNYARLV